MTLAHSEPRLRWMAVSLTTQQVRDRIKTQTRRDGWLQLKAGDQLALCPKYRGVPRGERELITIVDVLSVRREPLGAITAADVLAEGFPDLSPAEFVEFFCRTHRGITPDREVTRIEWGYPRICRRCGCTDYAACDSGFGPCAWTRMFDDNTGICTACPPATGNRTESGIDRPVPRTSLERAGHVAVS
ncbi:Uncharacterised protein [Mycobacteroides abscessus subsp. bolletii]|uniref:hypothetical protein n=1 Tax=Mycobacteroides abscessus TaxID=36809 RepID=UPI000927EACE|nr:hypothetical protein [Mycobacteroides abscessus]SIN48439.1 Uncharacterised protein [Mycobacteroides abscessus subsp. bolletii]